VLCLECTKMIDIDIISDNLRSVRPNCGWLKLVKGHQRLKTRDFADAVELLEEGNSQCVLCPLMHMHLFT